MAWRLAKALDTYLAQINAAAPNRDKSSDGGIGDAAHASRSSDHNPWVKIGSMGIVRAYDITHDPEGGLDSYKLAEHLRVTADPRIDYIISDHKIADPGKPWRKYTGSNSHSHHVHISLSQSSALFDDVRPWDIGLAKAGMFTRTVAAVKKIVAPTPLKYPTLKRGSKGDDVKRLQRLMNFTGKDVDGDFGAMTEKAVVAAQTKFGLTIDGKAGPYTWRALEGQSTDIKAVLRATV